MITYTTDRNAYMTSTAFSRAGPVTWRQQHKRVQTLTTLTQPRHHSKCPLNIAHLEQQPTQSHVKLV